MERLRDQRLVPGSLEADASELLGTSEPYAVPSGLKRRVRERLVAGRPKRWLPQLLRPTLVAACSLLAVVVLAAVGRSRLERIARPAPAASAYTAPLTTASSMPESVAAASALPRPSGGYETEYAPRVELPPAASTDARGGEPEHVEPTAKPSTPSEAALVYGAAKALRNYGDAALAAKLLADYARRYPRGALAEEALALSIDVSLARGDGRAKQLATRYLARYPNGHFQAKAQGVLAP